MFNLSKHVGYEVVFNSSCEYELPKKYQPDTNKVFGFSVGLDRHMDSARFGWHWENGEIHICAYVYNDGTKIIRPMTTVQLGVKTYLSIEMIDDKYVFTIALGNGQQTIYELDTNTKFMPGFSLWPFFGGRMTAPHDISVEMSKS